uniref:CUB_2 domain-containing protein n=1 Tax=Caenorhabditis tropicalis TaxID=1561998 RepID=A0A1I7T104_9PELO
MLSFLFLIGTLLISVDADGYSCAGNTLVNPPEDINQPYYYPQGWNEGLEPATYAGSQTCNWQINVPQGMYATVIFYKNTDSESGINCVYPNGQQEYIEDKEHNPFIFTSPQFQVNLRVSDKQGELSFKVVWSKYPGTCKINMVLDDKSGLSGSPNECVTTYSSPNKVVLVGFSLKDDLDVSLRQSAVFVGDSTDGEYIGNLYYARYSQIVSPTNKLTIYTFGLDKEFNYTLYMGMDSYALGDVQQINGMNCPSNPNKACYITLNAYNNVSAIATIGRQPDFLKQFFQFPAGSTLKIYEEQISDSNLLATIDRSNYMNIFPMAVKTSLKIYHLDTGRISIPVAKNAVDAQYSTVYDGRFVNIHSNDYRRTAYTQDTFESFKTENNQKLYFKFTTKYFDVNGNTTLGITINKDGNVVYSDSFTGTHLPPANTIKILGDTMTVNYQTYGNYTRGFEVDLLTTRNG